MKEGLLKKRVTLSIVIFRLAILLSLPVLKNHGGIATDEMQQLYYLLLPLSFVYFALSIKFIMNNRYLLSGKSVNKSYFLMGYPLLGFLYLLEIGLIFCKGFFNLPSIAELYTSIIIIECLLGAYTGFYLSDLFAKNQHRVQEETTEEV